MPLSFACDLCKTSFVRQAHVDSHRGTRTCVRRQMENLGLELPRRGLGSSGNLRRVVRSRIAPFILYLKANLRFCRATRGESVPVVPYDVTKVSADFVEIIRGIRQEFRKRRLNPGCKTQRASVLSTCFANASTMTAHGVETIGIVPVPFSKTHEDALVERAMAKRARGAQIFNTGMLYAASRSVVNKGKKEAQRSLRRWARDIRSMSEKVEGSLERWQGPSQRWQGPSQSARPDIFLKLCGSSGFPAWGYSQHLGQNLWNCGFAKAHGLELKTDRFLPLGGGKGPRGALARLLGPVAASPEKLKLEGYLRFCIHEVSAVVRMDWSKHGEPIRRDERSLTDEHDIIIAQLCEWERAGYGTELAEDHKMMSRFG